MRKIHYIFISLLLFTGGACVTKYNYKFDKVDQEELGRRTRSLEMAYKLKENEMWLIFFTGFNKTQIRITENKKVKFDTIISSRNKYPFMPNVFKIKKKCCCRNNFKIIF